jgi:hypothetical protein
MIAFGHNEHEIVAARALARELGMGFSLKRNYDDSFSPVKERDTVRTTVTPTHLEAQELSGEGDEYLSDDICAQLWRQPQINFDGTLLGCCVNMWASFGENVFAVGVTRALAASPPAAGRERRESPPRSAGRVLDTAAPPQAPPSPRATDTETPALGRPPAAPPARSERPSSRCMA